MTSRKKDLKTPKPTNGPASAPPSTASATAEQTGNASSVSFPIVGIGASAGGLAAFEAFFSGLPADVEPGMAFVLVQHLAPDHASMLVALVQRHTRMQVVEVQDGVQVQINCAYVIPPNRDMAFLNGALHLLEPSAPRGHRLPIDYLFLSLAQDQRERAIGIVLSGTGSDGTAGVRAIKAGGGMVMAQSTDSCEFDGMPRSAIATGLVDFELPPAEMAEQLIAYVAHAFGSLSRRSGVNALQDESALKKIYLLLRSQVGHDFSQYKPSTLCRRIERRMAVHQIDQLDGYVKYLQQTASEADALFRDLLIGVTDFFRDPDAFEVLEQQTIPLLFEAKPAGATIRAWVAGCSTGEEAYSLAILLQERAEALKSSFKVQVFATDIDSRAIDAARLGVYPASIAADISPERLARFFTVEADGSAYRVHKTIRDMLVFSEHSVIKDPPFSRLDLISCRNLLIYMNSELQKKLITLFHYALNPGGTLFLGTSETVGELSDLFGSIDRKAKLYRRKEDFQGASRAALNRFLPPMRLEVHTQPAAGAAKVSAKLSLRELTEQSLLQHMSPVAALVNAQGDILYLHGRTGMFLEPAPGDASINNILKMARDGLRHDLTTLLNKVAKAAHGAEPLRVAGLRVKTNGHFSQVNLSVSAVPTASSASSASSASAGSAHDVALFLVVLELAPAADLHFGSAAVQTASARLRAVPPSKNDASGAATDAANQQIAALNEELRAKEEYLQATNEELETSIEELKSSNEEMQSVNEELQSTNEELETSKEEMQSINEELSTVNTELQSKVQDLSRANNDMNNLLAGTGIGTVFIDHKLNIVRFTPAATTIINLILSDVGRPVGHIVSNLVGYDALVHDVRSVLSSLIPKEVDVKTAEGKHYTLRILPYRTLDNVIEGAVITFTDITEMVRTRVALRKANELLRLAVVVRDAFDAITVQDLDGRTLAWNPGAVRMYGWTEAEALTLNVSQRIPQQLRAKALSRVTQLKEAETLEPYATERIAKDGSVIEVSITSTALLDEAGQMIAIATTERASARPESTP